MAGFESSQDSIEADESVEEEFLEPAGLAALDPEVAAALQLHSLESLPVAHTDLTNATRNALAAEVALLKTMTAGKNPTQAQKLASATKKAAILKARKIIETAMA